MDSKTREMVKGWLAMHHGDVESLARWMRDSLRLAGLRECRSLIREATVRVCSDCDGNGCNNCTLACADN